ncbi:MULTISPECIES: tRNA (adenine(22)-N(1))-methyltransferase [Lactobacillus]|uniref:tRNA (adenine(22)-N(1))-methyltransferase n=1 Tax=Lactobacillus TaxID=1578 RepID=UPI0024917FB2|nr:MULTISPECIES: class I SAM-dependent methyltransferase [Lactobacillus]
MNLRLKSLANMVDPGSRVADIGTDHAYLPIELVKTGKINYAIASDIGQGPIKNAQEDIRKAGFENQIETRLGNGLDTVSAADQIDTVVIAGMGGKLMTEILNTAWLRNLKFPTLVLEANIGEPEVRGWVMIHGYQIVQERLIAEAGHTYELIKAKKINQIVPLTEKELLFGPLILKAKEPIFKQKWQRQLSYYQQLLVSLNKAKNKNVERINHINHLTELIKEELDD